MIGSAIHFFDTVPSTQEVARSMALNGAPDGSVVIADGQNQGRGRMGRSWYAPPRSSLLMSIVLRPKGSDADLASFNLVAALAIAAGIKGVTGLTPGLKWPNDLYINGRKVCGILAERFSGSDPGDRITILGVGVNVNIRPNEFPEDLCQKATSLLIETGMVISRKVLCKEILASLDQYFKVFTEKGFISFKEEAEALLVSLGKQVVFFNGKESVSGFVLGLSEDGGLVVDLDGGNVRVVHGGEVTFNLPSVNRPE